MTEKRFEGIKIGRRENTPAKSKRSEKMRVKKESITQNISEAENAGRFAKRFSGERPDPLGFELTFLSESK